ncbi:MAG: DsbA family protein [Acidimicrobiales bacterium]
MSTSFSVTWDYRCPFARIAHEHVVEGLLDGADWNVTFVPFSLGQVHVEEGQPDIWETPELDTGLLALQAGVVVRDSHPDRFLQVHRGLFAARHVDGAQLREPEVVRGVLTESGADADAVFAEIATGAPLETIRKEHEASVANHEVWGVPTFIAGDKASFVRLMATPDGDAAVARRTIERIVDLLTGWPELNEFKHTSLSR